MKYFVIAHDGKKYGPADADTLTQWASEGRITPATELEEEMTGRRLMARDVDGIILSESAGQEPGDRHDAPSQPTTTQSNPYTSSGPQSSYGSPHPPSNPYSQPPSNYPRGATGGYDPSLDQKVTTSWIMVVLGFVCCPIFAIVGTVMAYDAKKKGHPSANAPFIVGIILIALSLIWIPIALVFGMFAPFMTGF